MLIGITGTLGSGKGTIVDYLVKKRGFKHYSVRQFITSEIIRKKMIVNRDNMVKIANLLREKYGSSYIIRRLYKEAIKQGGNMVIESIRNPNEAKFLKQKGAIIFSVDADPKLRYKRIKLRSNETDNVSFRQFMKQEKRELTSKLTSAINLNKVISMADYNFSNNGTKKKLYNKIEAVFKNIF